MSSPEDAAGWASGRPSDEALIGLALDEARLALPDDVPIGAVVLSAEGSVLGRGHNEREAAGDPTAHAEILALRAAAVAVGSWNLSGTTIAVTVEPCTMCAGAIVAARVQRLVFGCWEPKTGAVGFAVGRGARPSVDPPGRGQRRRACGAAVPR